MTGDQHQAENAAVDWLVRQRDPSFAEWEAFTGWLEADAANAKAYHRVAAADRDVDELLAPETRPDAVQLGDAASEMKVPVVPPGRRSWPRWAAGGAIAAALALAAGLELRPGSPQSYSVATAPGERRTVEIEPGTRIAMNGGTRLVLDRSSPRRARLDRGQALFVVRHDDSDPFQVTVAGTEVVDVGTEFEVTTRKAGFDIAVSEGRVVVDPAGQATELTAGQALQVSGAEFVRRPVEPDLVGQWRRNRLSYNGATLATVALDLARNLGVQVEVDPGLSRRQFRGTIILDGGADAVAARVPAALDVRLVRTGDRWRLAASP